jgi:hypothetical protein
MHSPAGVVEEEGGVATWREVTTVEAEGAATKHKSTTAVNSSTDHNDQTQYTVMSAIT